MAHIDTLCTSRPNSAGRRSSDDSMSCHLRPCDSVPQPKREQRAFIAVSFWLKAVALVQKWPHLSFQMKVEVRARWWPGHFRKLMCFLSLCDVLVLVSRRMIHSPVAIVEKSLIGQKLALLQQVH
eukprot:2920426-Amphidinium_carterae.1